VQVVLLGHNNLVLVTFDVEQQFVIGQLVAYSVPHYHFISINSCSSSTCGNRHHYRVGEQHCFAAMRSLSSLSQSAGDSRHEV
jgi:hypothetical protein